MIKVDVSRLIRATAGSNYRRLKTNALANTLRGQHAHGVIILEASLTVIQINVVALEKAVMSSYLYINDFMRACQHLRQRQAANIGHARQQWVTAKTHQVIDGLAQCLGWNSAHMRTVATNFAKLIDHRNAPAFLNQFHGRTLTRRSSTNHYHIVTR